MKIVTALAAAALALTTAGCATPGFAPADLVKAANDLDPDCYKDVDIKVTPMLVFGWVVPIVTGSYRKVCHPEKAPAGTAPLQVGSLIQ